MLKIVLYVYFAAIAFVTQKGLDHLKFDKLKRTIHLLIVYYFANYFL